MPAKTSILFMSVSIKRGSATMPKKMLGCLLWVAMLANCVSGVSGRWSNDRVESCDEEIKKMLQILTNEVAELKKEVREMNTGCKLEEKETSENETKENETNENEMNSDVKYKILSASRKSVVGGKRRHTIRYQFPGNGPFPVLWQVYSTGEVLLTLPETISNEIPNLPPGVYETSTTTTPSSGSYLYVTIGHRKEGVLLALNNHEDMPDVTETDIEIPIADIAPKGDIVYEPGHNATITILQPPEKEYYLHYALINTANNESYFGGSRGTLHVKNNTLIEDRIETKFEILTEDTPFTGILSIIYDIQFDYSSTGLVTTMTYTKEIVLRPSTQERAFPEGKIYAVDRDEHLHRKRDENGDIVRYCAYGNTCWDRCTFFGNDLNCLEVFKTVNGNTTQEEIVESIGRNIEEVAYTKDGYFYISPVESDPSPATYTCRTRNVKGQTLTSKMVFHFGYESNIVLNETSMELFDNGTAKIVCTAHGRPLPDVRIYCDGRKAKSDVVYQSDDVISVTATCVNINEYSHGNNDCTVRNILQRAFHSFGKD